MFEQKKSFRRPLLLATMALALTIGACRDDGPETTPATQQPPEPRSLSSDTVDTNSIDTLGMALVPDTSMKVTGAAPGARYDQGWNRTELVEGVRRFISAIDSNDQDLFWGSLSDRSTRMISGGSLGSRDEIWSAARQTLGDIQNRRITVIGGSRDSVALRIDGLRLVDSARVDDPVIVHLLREKGSWKVMYPGLLYPQHHLLR